MLERRLHEAVNAVALSALFSPKVYAAINDLGVPDRMPVYLAERTAPLGAAPAATVTAVLAYFQPDMVRVAMPKVWAATTPDALLDARDAAIAEHLDTALGGSVPDGTLEVTTLLRRAVEAAPTAGHPIASALRARPSPEHPLGALFRACDILREHRGESHIAAWTVAGRQPFEMLLLSERKLGWMPLGEMAYMYGWWPDEAAAGYRALHHEGLLDADFELTERGHALRDAIEDATDVAEAPTIAALDEADLSTVEAYFAQVTPQVMASIPMPPPDSPKEGDGGVMGPMPRR